MNYHEESPSISFTTRNRGKEETELFISDNADVVSIFSKDVRYNNSSTIATLTPEEARVLGDFLIDFAERKESDW